MKVAVFSDMHGNCVALEAVLADLKNEKIDQLVCLGDAIQGGPQPAQVVARLRELGCPVVMGNADAWMLTGIETGAEAFSPERVVKMEAIRQWSLTQLSEADRAFIEAFHPTVSLPLEGGHNLLAFHGSPTSFDDIILLSTPHEEVEKFLGAYAANILTGGHTHAQQVRRLGDNFFFNPGSVGVAYSHHQPEDQFHTDPWAEYAVLTSTGARLSLDFRRIPYDVAELIRVYRASGRPHIEDALAQMPNAAH